MCAAERKVPSFAEVHIPATDGSTFLQLKMAGAGLCGVGVGIKDLSDTGDVHEVVPYPNKLNHIKLFLRF